MTLSGQSGPAEDTPGDTMNHQIQQDDAAKLDNVDDLFTHVREALSAQHQAGYLRGRYGAGVDDTDGKLCQDMLQATAKADELTVSLWRKLYDVAPGIADRLQLQAAAIDLED